MVLFFLFQAEDGIRDLTVTGVQTCALPISASATAGCPDGRRRGPDTWSQTSSPPPDTDATRRRRRKAGLQVTIAWVLGHMLWHPRVAARGCQSTRYSTRSSTGLTAEATVIRK